MSATVDPHQILDSLNFSIDFTAALASLEDVFAANAATLSDVGGGATSLASDEWRRLASAVRQMRLTAQVFGAAAVAPRLVALLAGALSLGANRGGILRAPEELRPSPPAAEVASSDGMPPMADCPSWKTLGGVSPDIHQHPLLLRRQHSPQAVSLSVPSAVDPERRLSLPPPQAPQPHPQQHHHYYHHAATLTTRQLDAALYNTFHPSPAKPAARRTASAGSAANHLSSLFAAPGGHDLFSRSSLPSTNGNHYSSSASSSTSSTLESSLASAIAEDLLRRLTLSSSGRS